MKRMGRIGHTVAQAAAILGVSRSAIYRALTDGRLTGHCNACGDRLELWRRDWSAHECPNLEDDQAVTVAILPYYVARYQVDVTRRRSGLMTHTRRAAATPPATGA